MAENNSTVKSLILKTLFIIGIVVIMVILAFAVIKFIPKVISSFASVGSLINVTKDSETTNESDEYIDSDTDSTLDSEFIDDSENSQSNSGNNSNQNFNNQQTGISNSIPADLAITNLFKLNDNTVTFTISNIGGRSTGNWIFNYAVTGEGTDVSPLQPSLLPGSAIRYTLNFNNDIDGIITVSVDPTNSVFENSESNNIRSISFNSNSFNNSNNYNSNDEADLVIRNYEVGRLQGSRFIEDDEIDTDDDAAIRFTVVNIGGESTGDWRFEIDNTPYDGSNDFRSKRQDSLRPGESITLTVEFENPDDGRYRIRVDVDSDHDVDEENERNNDETETLRVLR
jgi:subtilase family serine protease